MVPSDPLLSLVSHQRQKEERAAERGTAQRRSTGGGRRRAASADHRRLQSSAGAFSDRSPVRIVLKRWDEAATPVAPFAGCWERLRSSQLISAGV